MSLPGMMNPMLMKQGAGSLFAILQSLGLTGSLQTCLDAGELTSYDGTSQTWVDLTGNGYSFFRGTTSGSESSDPTFNGTAGNLSSNEYFSFDGGDWFTLNQTNPAWVNALHKDNAVFSSVAWTNRSNLLGDAGASGTGALIGVSGSDHPFLQVFNGASTVLNATSTLTVSTGVWQMSALSFNETSGALTFGVNGSFDAQTGKTYTSPSAGSAGSTLQIGSIGGGSSPAAAGRQIAMLAIWSTDLSQTQMTSIFNATRDRFGV